MKVPLDDQGNLLDYTWKGPLTEVEDFDGTLQFRGFYRGRSSAGASFKCVDNGKNYPMFLMCLDEVIRHGIGHGGYVSGRWTFIKRGRNYSIRLVQ